MRTSISKIKGQKFCIVQKSYFRKDRYSLKRVIIISRSSLKFHLHSLTRKSTSFYMQIMPLVKHEHSRFPQSLYKRFIVSRLLMQIAKCYSKPSKTVSRISEDLKNTMAQIHHPFLMLKFTEVPQC